MVEKSLAMTQQGKAKARQGKARQRQRQGKARQGKARQGKARQGKARQSKSVPYQHTEKSDTPAAPGTVHISIADIPATPQHILWYLQRRSTKINIEEVKRDMMELNNKSKT